METNLNANRTAALAAIVAGDTVKVLLEGNPSGKVITAIDDRHILVDLDGEGVVVNRVFVIRVNGKSVRG